MQETEYLSRSGLIWDLHTYIYLFSAILLASFVTCASHVQASCFFPLGYQPRTTTTPHVVPTIFFSSSARLEAFPLFLMCLGAFSEILSYFPVFLYAGCLAGPAMSHLQETLSGETLRWNIPSIALSPLTILARSYVLELEIDRWAGYYSILFVSHLWI